jgi:hypothetical protein
MLMLTDLWIIALTSRTYQPQRAASSGQTPLLKPAQTYHILIKSAQVLNNSLKIYLQNTSSVFEGVLKRDAASH